MNTQTFITLYEKSSTDITGKKFAKLTQYWTDIVNDSVYSSEMSYLYSVLTKNRKFQLQLKKTWGNRLRYDYIRKVALTLSEQDVLGIVFICYQSNVYAFEHNFNSMLRVKPIRECSQFTKMESLMLDAEKDLKVKPNGKYEFCPVSLKWLNIPISDYELTHLCLWLFDRGMELNKTQAKHNLDQIKQRFELKR